MIAGERLPVGDGDHRSDAERQAIAELFDLVLTRPDAPQLLELANRRGLGLSATVALLRRPMLRVINGARSVK